MSPPPKKAPAKKAAPRGKAAAKVVASADDDDEAAPVKPAPKGRGRKAAVIIDSDEEEVPKPAAVKPAAKPAAKNARGAKAKTAVIDDSEDDDDVPNHESMQVSPAPKSGGQEAVYDFDEASPVPKAVQKRPLAKKPAALKDEVPFITDYKEYHTDLDVRFVVSLSAENMQLALKEGLNKKFKLSTTMGTTNMMLFNKDGKITKYPQPEDIMREFFDVRIDFYERRKKFLLYVAEQEMLRLSNKVRFILGVVNGEIKVSNRKKKLIEVDLERMGFDKLLKSGIPGVKMAASGAGAEDDGNENSEESAEGAAPAAAPGMSYEYLLSMPIYSLTLEKVEQLCTERDGKQVEVDSLKATTCKDLWLTDLDCFLEGLTQMEETEAAEALKLTKQQAQACNGKNRARGAGKKKATSDSDMSEDDDDF
eukprot:gene29659-36953_t